MLVSSPGTCSRKRCVRVTPAGCAPPSSTTTTCSHSASWSWCSPSCSTSCACGGSTSGSSGRPRPWTSSGSKRGRPSSPEGGDASWWPAGFHVCRIRTTTKQCECGGQIREPGRSSTSQGWDLASEDEKRRARILFCGKTSQHRVGLMSLESNCSVLTLIVQLQTERHFLPLYFGRKESTRCNRIEQLSLFCPHFSKDPKPRVWAYLQRQSGRLASIRWVDRCRDRRRRRWCSPAEDI